jgi:hypothetical protein
MTEEKKKDVILETTPEIIREAKTMIRTARSASIATIEPGTGWPIATRVGVSTDIDGAPILLISKLAAHTPALLADARCSLLIGLPGKGDPLAHGRLTLFCEAREVERDSDEHHLLEGRYLTHQQKAKLYSGLGDFRYFRLEPRRVSMNGGFGRAYAPKPEDMLTRSPANTALARSEQGIVEHMNDDHAEAVGLYAECFCKAPAGNWKLLGVDAEGFDLADGDDVRRVWFPAQLSDAEEVHKALVKMAGEARKILNRPRIRTEAVS